MSAMALPPPIVPMDEVAVIDAASEALGVPVADLMERAGEALAREALRLAPAGPVLVACGPGNNGGDGWVCARILHGAGIPVAVWAVVPPVTDLAVAAAAACPPGVDRVEGVPAGTALVVDALLGAGIRGRPRGPVAAAIQHLRGLRLPVLAADVPSGLGSDLVLPAVRTVCFGTAKQELIGSPMSREFITVDIGIPDAAVREVQPACAMRFPPLHRDAHKGQHGEVLVVGGGPYPGAVELAGTAALRTGCDLVRIWTSGAAPMPPSLIVHRQLGDGLVPADPSELSPLLVRAGCLLVGPGLGRSEGAHAAARQALSLALELGVPVVVDADGLAACADLVRAKPEGEDRLLVTPHRGEARALVGSAEDEALHAFARRDRVVLAKGAVDLVSDGRRWQRNRRGNPRMAVGGTGDCLAGLCAGLMARGCTAFDAARLGVLWLTTAGDRRWAAEGPCYRPEDLLDDLAGVLRDLLLPLDRWPPVR
ncbi:MAG: hypothetical protein RLZZ127_3150 [Planctomycetota bacterium]|jgi:NAD(P)H-hydrate epimerase